MKKILIVACLLLNFQVSHALTRGQIITEVRRLVHDTNSRRWTDVQISTFVNLAQDEILSFSWALHNIYEFTTISGTTEYVMPNDFIQPERVYYESEVLPEISLSRLDTEDATWTKTNSGQPDYYYIRRGTVTWFGLYPCPDEASPVRVDYTELADDLTTDSIEPFNGLPRMKPYHFLIVLWCTYYCYLQEGQIQTASAYYEMYAIRLKDMRETLGLRSNYQPTIRGQ